MTGAAKDLAVVVVNYGSHQLLRENLVPVSEHTPEALVVVVDNPTTGLEREAVRELAGTRGWELVESSTNVGFGAGVNLGVSRARGLGATKFLILARFSFRQGTLMLYFIDQSACFLFGFNDGQELIKSEYFEHILHFFIQSVDDHFNAMRIDVFDIRHKHSQPSRRDIS